MNSPLRTTARAVESCRVIYGTWHEKARRWIEEIIYKNKAPKQCENESYF